MENCIVPTPNEKKNESYGFCESNPTRVFTVFHYLNNTQKICWGSLCGKDKMKIPSKYRRTQDTHRKDGKAFQTFRWVSFQMLNGKRNSMLGGGISTRTNSCFYQRNGSSDNLKKNYRGTGTKESTWNITFMVTLSAISMTGPTGNETSFKNLPESPYFSAIFFSLKNRILNFLFF